MILEFFNFAIVITANELHPEFCKLMIKQFLHVIVLVNAIKDKRKNRLPKDVLGWWKVSRLLDKWCREQVK